MGVKSRYREKPAKEIPTGDEITKNLIGDTISPGERQLNEPPALPAEAVNPGPPDGGETEIPPEGEGADGAGDNEAVREALQQQADADA